MPKKSLAYNSCANRLASVFSFTPGVKLSRAGRPSWVTRSHETSAALRKANGKGGKKGNFNHRRFHVRRHGVPIQPQPSKTELTTMKKASQGTGFRMKSPMQRLLDAPFKHSSLVHKKSLKSKGLLLIYLHKEHASSVQLVLGAK